MPIKWNKIKNKKSHRHNVNQNNCNRIDKIHTKCNWYFDRCGLSSLFSFMWFVVSLFGSFIKSLRFIRFITFCAPDICVCPAFVAALLLRLLTVALCIFKKIQRNSKKKNQTENFHAEINKNERNTTVRKIDWIDCCWTGYIDVRFGFVRWRFVDCCSMQNVWIEKCCWRFRVFLAYGLNMWRTTKSHTISIAWAMAANCSASHHPRFTSPKFRTQMHSESISIFKRIKIKQNDQLINNHN